MSSEDSASAQGNGAVIERSWLGKMTWPVTHYVVTMATTSLGVLLFRVFNRTTFVGRENVPCKPNTLLLSNHQTLIDNFLVGMGPYYAQAWLKPHLIPWNPAAEENYFRGPILAWLSDNWKCIPIKKGRKDVGSLHKMALALQTSPLLLFPEGTRTRDGSIGKARGGAGLLILETHPAVVPVCIDGMSQVLPVGARFPRFFKRIVVRYGKPIDLSEFYAEKRSKRAAIAIMDRVMDSIRALRPNGKAAAPAARPREPGTDPVLDLIS